MTNSTDDRAALIRTLNDQFRTTLDESLGKLCLAYPVYKLPGEKLHCLVALVSNLDDFTEDNDAYDEHDCAFVELDGQTYMFKIDYCDPEYKGLSQYPESPALSRRLLTIFAVEKPEHE